MTQERVIICMKWGTLYPATYVNVLYSAVRGNISGDFRFVCLTDDPAGLRPEVEHFPIPDMGLEESHWKKGGWPKLCVFAADFFGLSGRALFIDLDTVICGALDPMFNQPGEIIAIDAGPNWKNPAANAPKSAATCVFAFTLGAHPEILQNFLDNRDAMVATHRIEQVYLEAVFPQISFWPAEWTVSFKYSLRRPVVAGWFVPPHAPRPENIILAFHGEPRPIDLINGGVWGIAPHWGFGKVGWMVDYWTKNGG